MIFSLLEEDFVILESRHVLLRAIYLIYACFLFSWSMLTLIEHFSKDIFHISFWLAYDILYIVICAISVGFAIRYNATKGSIGLNTTRTIALVNFCIFMACVAVVNNLTHFIFTVIDLSDGYTDAAYWFIVAFTALLGLLVCLDCLNILYLVRYREDMRTIGLRRKNK